jgi:hypothetical protein
MNHGLSLIVCLLTANHLSENIKGAVIWYSSRSELNIHAKKKNFKSGFDDHF